MVWVATSAHATEVVNFMPLVYGTVVHFINQPVHVCAPEGRRVVCSPMLLEVSRGAVWRMTKCDEASSI